MMICVCNSIIIINKLQRILAKKDSPDATSVTTSPTMKSDGIFLSQNGHFTPKEKHIQTMISVCKSFFKANTTDSRTLVQLFTGCPTTAITLNFWEQLIPKHHLMQDRYQSQVIFFQPAWRSLIMLCPMFYICRDWLSTPFSGLFTHSSLHTLSLTSHSHYTIFHPLFSMALLSLYVKLLKSP